ncbi:hypothetical protein ACFY72_15745 [Streptomyces globisporus]|uniref:hypothetical protein n=1 Tax=Streptomyces TaxID=1883 RepID=UPI001F3E0218|nr:MULTISPECIES: hypothetical protein [Streptomyces]UIZ16752.1 hypothetical protein LZ559_32385 [Streptomyces sp. R527F]
MVFVGLFPAPFPQGHPVRCTVLNRPGAFALDNVPSGRWHVLARSVMHPTDGGRRARHTPMVGGFGPITTSADHALEPVVIHLSRENLATLRLIATAPAP